MRLYFSESERRKYWFRFRLIVYGVILILGGLSIGAVYALRETSLFALNGLYVLGIPQSERIAFISDIEPLVYRNALARLVGSDNLLAWPDELPVPGPEFSKLEVEKDLFNRTITLHARRRERFGIWCLQPRIIAEENAEQRGQENLPRESASGPQNSAVAEQQRRCFWIDSEDGTLFEEAPYGKGHLFITIFERDDDATGTPQVQKPALGGRVLEEAAFGRLKMILEAVRELGLTSERIEIDRARQSAYFISGSGPTLEFSLRFDFDDSYAKALKELFSSRPPETLRYVDLTVQNKVYVK